MSRRAAIFFDLSSASHLKFQRQKMTKKKTPEEPQFNIPPKTKQKKNASRQE